MTEIFQKLEREEERKKKIAEKLAAGKIVGQNKREKGRPSPEGNRSLKCNSRREESVSP